MKEKAKINSNKSFGLVFFVVFFLIALYPLVNNQNIGFWSLSISFVFLILGLMNSKILTPLNKLWFKLGIFLGKIISPFIMGMIFFLVVTPIGFIMRILGKDLLNLKYNNNKSYWIEKNEPKSKMEFLKIRKKYWLLPIILVLIIFGGLIVLTQGSAVAPFIYTIF